MDTDTFFAQTHNLENSRVRLEPLQEFHFRALLPVAMEKDLWLYTAASVVDEADFRRYFDQALHDRASQMAYPFAVFDKQTGEYAGSTRYGNISLQNKRLEIGWTWYAKRFQRSGLNQATKFLLLNYGFTSLALNRIELKTSHLNLRSQKAIAGIGATKEGILRKHLIGEDGTVRDTVYFSFINSEWQEIKSRIFSSVTE